MTLPMKLVPAPLAIFFKSLETASDMFCLDTVIDQMLAEACIVEIAWHKACYVMNLMER